MICAGIAKCVSRIIWNGKNESLVKGEFVATINVSKKVVCFPANEQGNPKVANCPVKKLWKPKDGATFPTVKGLVQLSYIDSAVLDENGMPYVFYDYMPEKYLHVVNDSGPGAEMWPAPSDELADDEELVTGGPGMWSVVKKGGSSMLEQARVLIRKGLAILEQIK